MRLNFLIRSSIRLLRGHFHQAGDFFLQILGPLPLEGRSAPAVLSGYR